MKVYTEAPPPAADTAPTPPTVMLNSPPSSTTSSSTYKRRRTKIDKKCVKRCISQQKLSCIERISTSHSANESPPVPGRHSHAAGMAQTSAKSRTAAPFAAQIMPPMPPPIYGEDDDASATNETSSGQPPPRYTPALNQRNSPDPRQKDPNESLGLTGQQNLKNSLHRYGEGPEALGQRGLINLDKKPVNFMSPQDPKYSYFRGYTDLVNLKQQQQQRVVDSVAQIGAVIDPSGLSNGNGVSQMYPQQYAWNVKCQNQMPVTTRRQTGTPTTKRRGANATAAAARRHPRTRGCLYMPEQMRRNISSAQRYRLYQQQLSEDPRLQAQVGAMLRRSQRAAERFSNPTARPLARRRPSDSSALCGATEPRRGALKIGRSSQQDVGDGAESPPSSLGASNSADELRTPLIAAGGDDDKRADRRIKPADKSVGRRFLSKHLTGKTNGGDFSESWREKFSHHPSWCDADMCLQQIEAGNAHGNRVALYSRAFFQRALYRLGDTVQHWPKLVIFVAAALLSLCLIGLKDVQIETDLVKLWVEQGGRLDEELAFFGEARARYYARQQQQQRTRTKRATAAGNTTAAPIKPVQVTRRPPPVEIPSDTGLSGGFQVVIQTPEDEGANVLTRDALLRHVHVLEEIARYEVEMFGETWGLSDICFKPPAPKVPRNNLLAGYQHVFDKLIPCIWITPADCFWEASKALGPYPSVSLEGADAILPHLPRGNLSWRTLDPELLLKDLADYKELIGNINEVLASLFNRAGVGHAYQDRPCIEPLDHECPTTAPNYFDRCGAYKKFLKWNERRPAAERVKLTAEELPKPTASSGPDIDFSQFLGRRKRRDAPMNGTKAMTSDDYYNDDQVEDVKATTVSPADATAKQFNKTCEQYAKSFLAWMRAVGPHNWQFLEERIPDLEVAPPQYPHYGEQLTNGCEGFGRNIMKWPEDLIVGGVRRENGVIMHAEAFQSVFLVAAAGDVFQRFKHKDAHVKPNLDTSAFTPSHAGAIIQKWQRSFTERLYAHPLNDNAGRQRMRVETHQRALSEFGASSSRASSVQGVTITDGTTDFTHEGELVGGVEGEEQIRVIHPLASTSIQDMLKEFSKFQFGVIFMGYLLMVLYAGFTQFDWDGWWFSARSNCFLAIVGVFIITYASIAGLGLSAVMGIHFNAATTQIVPFLTLGLGIDDMFLFLHNYGGVLESVRKREVAILVKETGMSIFITSSNNILAFVAGTILPIPALRSFCAQTAILLFFNLISIVVVFPAFITLDLRRRKLGVRDMTCGCCWASSANRGLFETAGVPSENSSRNKLAKDPSVDSIAAMEEMAVAYGQSLTYDMNVFPLAETGSSSAAAHARKQREVQRASHRHHDEPLYTLEGFLHRFYIPTLMKPTVKFIVIFISVSMFAFGCVGLRDNVLGLELADVLPESTPPAAFLRAREKYFSFYPIFVVLKEGIDYPRQQDTIEQLRLDIGKSSFVIKGDTILRHIQEPSEHYWIWYMRQYLKSLQTSLDAAITAGQIDVNTGSVLKRPLKDDAAIGRRLLCSQGTQFNCTGRMKRRLVDDNDVVIRDSFYNCLTAWYTLDNMMYYVSQGQIFPPPPAWAYNSSDDGLIPPAENISYSQIPFYLTGLTDTPVIVRMIEEVRAVCERYTAVMNLPVFPTGIPFTFWEQYLSLTTYLFAAIVIIGVTVLLIISIIIFNPWAAAMVAIVVVSMTVELGGFMGLFGVKMNPISAVTLITAVGIGVEFTAHVVLAFLTSLGSKDERMASCLEHMFVPVVHGVLSTLLGIIMLAFSEFDFVVKYFFVVMTVLILIGMFNGLAMLPVMLSLIGPPCEVYPIDGGKRLPVPRYWPSKKKCGGGAYTSDGGSDNCAVSFDATPKKISPPPAFDAEKELGGHSYVYHGSLSTVAEEDPNRLSVKAGANTSSSIMSASSPSSPKLTQRGGSGRARSSTDRPASSLSAAEGDQKNAAGPERSYMHM